MALAEAAGGDGRREGKAMNGFYKGQKVVCIDAKTPKGPRYLQCPLVEDKIYTVDSLKSWPCGIITISVGITAPRDMFVLCHVCGANHPANGIWWFRTNRFIPLDEYTELDKAVSEISKPQVVEL